VISALGPNRQSLSRGLRRAQSGVRELSLFDVSCYRSRWAGEAPTPEPSAFLGPFRRCSRADLLGLHAAEEALRDADLDVASRHDTAVIVGTGAGGAQRTAQYLERLGSRGENGTPAAWLIPHQPANTTDVVANRLGMHGPRLSLMTACSSSATAIGLGLDMIRLGRVDRVLAGGAECLSALTFGGFSALRAMDNQPCRPFHVERKGLTLGEAGVMLLLEAADSVARDGRAPAPYAALAGYGVSADAHHLTAPAPDGRGATAAMRSALRDAQLAPEQVQYVNAHGTATIHNDPIEVEAIRQVFGPHADRLVVSSTKAMTGHALGAAGALEAAICALSVSEGLVPPTLRLDQPDPACDLDLVPLKSRDADLQAALSNSFAFGGNNTSLVLRRVT
jgi:3-oxoacyl-[acyl-carrier-protein] synthase II